MLEIYAPYPSADIPDWHMDFDAIDNSCIRLGYSRLQISGIAVISRRPAWQPKDVLHLSGMMAMMKALVASVKKP